MEYKDYYKTLGVDRDASEGEIKKAFRRLARKHHPDVAEDKGGSEAKFKEINEAYEVLGDAEKRKRYDAMGPGWNAQGGAAHGAGGVWPGGGADDFEFEFGGTGFSDFFERYFGGRGRPGGHGYGESRQKGHDIEGDIMVTLTEAMEGALRTISLRQPPAGGQPGQVREVQVRIPPGIGEGQRLRVPGQGASGRGGAAAGDLFLRVRLAADADYQVHGHDLHRDLKLTPWEAVLGATIPVQLPGGRKVQVKVPAGTSGGDQLRLRGYGLPNKRGAGDLYVEIQITVPEKLGNAEKGLWEQLAKASSFQPRRR